MRQAGIELIPYMYHPDEFHPDTVTTYQLEELIKITILEAAQVMNDNDFEDIHIGNAILRHFGVCNE